MSLYNVTETYTISRQTTFQTLNGYNYQMVMKNKQEISVWWLMFLSEHIFRRKNCSIDVKP